MEFWEYGPSREAKVEVDLFAVAIGRYFWHLRLPLEWVLAKHESDEPYSISLAMFANLELFFAEFVGLGAHDSKSDTPLGTIRVTQLFSHDRRHSHMSHATQNQLGDAALVRML
jgi:hypothetical protein